MTDMQEKMARAICEADGGDAEHIFQATNHIMACPTVASTCPMCEVLNYSELAKAAIAAHDKALKEQGLVIVPREPTDAMEKAGMWAAISHGEKTDEMCIYDGYQAMIDKALEGKE